MTRVSLEEQYNNKDVITQILKMRDDIARIAANAAGIQDITLRTTPDGWEFKFTLTDGTSYVFPMNADGYVTDGELATALADKADDDAVVKLTGAQTIHGVKTMDGTDGDLRVRTTPPNAVSAVNSAYVDDSTLGVNNILHKSGDETAAGMKIFTGQVDLESGLISRNMSIPNNTTVPGSILSKNFIFEAADFSQLGVIANITATNGNRVMRFRNVGTDGGNSDIDITRTSGGVAYVTAPYRSVGYGDNDVVTIGLLRVLGVIP